MKIRFKDGTLKQCINPKETMLFQNQKPAAWLFSFGMKITNAEEAEKILTRDNISKIGMETDNGEQGYSIGEYEEVFRVDISYGEMGGFALVELKRGVGNNENGEK